MKNKKLVLSVIALVAVIAVLAGIYYFTRPDTAAGEKAFTVTVVHKDGSEKVYEYTTAEEYLGPALVAEGLLEPSEDGMYNTIDGETADYSKDQSYWAFYIDGEYAMTGMDDTPVTEGASYKLEYTVYVEE